MFHSSRTYLSILYSWYTLYTQIISAHLKGNHIHPSSHWSTHGYENSTFTNNTRDKDFIVEFLCTSVNLACLILIPNAGTFEDEDLILNQSLPRIIWPLVTKVQSPNLMNLSRISNLPKAGFNWAPTKTLKDWI